MKTPTFRTVMFFIILFTTIVFPWWLTAPILLFLVAYFDFYMEVIFFGFVLDILYLAGEGYIYPALFASTVVLYLFAFVKTKIRT